MDNKYEENSYYERQALLLGISEYDRCAVITCVCNNMFLAPTYLHLKIEDRKNPPLFANCGPTKFKCSKCEEVMEIKHGRHVAFRGKQSISRIADASPRDYRSLYFDDYLLFYSKMLRHILYALLPIVLVHASIAYLLERELHFAMIYSPIGVIILISSAFIIWCFVKCYYSVRRFIKIESAYRQNDFCFLSSSEFCKQDEINKKYYNLLNYK